MSYCFTLIVGGCIKSDVIKSVVNHALNVVGAVVGAVVVVAALFDFKNERGVSYQSDLYVS